MNEPKNKGGRPRSENPRVERVTFRCTSEELQALQEAAKVAGKGIGPWARELLLREAS